MENRDPFQILLDALREPDLVHAYSVAYAIRSFNVSSDLRDLAVRGFITKIGLFQTFKSFQSFNRFAPFKTLQIVAVQGSNVQLFNDRRELPRFENSRSVGMNSNGNFARRSRLGC
jgi:hypothetical protein